MSCSISWLGDLYRRDHEPIVYIFEGIDLIVVVILSGRINLRAY